MRISDWSSDVCSSDLSGLPTPNGQANVRQNCSTQREWILRSGGQFSFAKKPYQSVQLVRQAHRHGHGRSGDFIALPDRLVVISDGVGHFGRKPFGTGVIAAHNALTFRKLSDHRSDESRVGKEGGRT